MCRFERYYLLAWFGSAISRGNFSNSLLPNFLTTIEQIWALCNKRLHNASASLVPEPNCQEPLSAELVVGPQIREQFRTGYPLKISLVPLDLLVLYQCRLQTALALFSRFFRNCTRIPKPPACLSNHADSSGSCVEAYLIMCVPFFRSVRPFGLISCRHVELYFQKFWKSGPEIRPKLWISVANEHPRHIVLEKYVLL